MNRKVVHISLPDEVYYKFKERAHKEHLKISTWLRQKLMEIYNGGRKG